MDVVEATCPLEDRTPERKVFQGVTEDSTYRAMVRACKLAGVPHYHPHDLRQPTADDLSSAGRACTRGAHLAAHSRTSESLDTYSHVMPLDELAAERLRALMGS